MEPMIMPWLEVEDPISACNGQPEGWLNRVCVECGRKQCTSGCLRGWRVSSGDEEVMAHFMWSVPLYNMVKNSDYTIWLYTL